ncbi:MAG: Asp-tRNA(Asn)/Glu-tRNA(Gln) amidotransferase subunit GatB [Candidatus Berkelbacteria bacterium]|nr:Asp-tRNA(Asn)/Glu-tRNA(Gln) amidotransferase subunit GatB [Candidatus Berkelbacteria bacterium]
MTEEFRTVIGLEIHVQLNTRAKMFCGCDNNAEGKEPNTVVCPVCMGMPGTLPVASREAIEKTIKLGLALGCEIPKISKFDRKHYFYPDLPKGYQISQYDQPFCKGGQIELESGTVKLNRVHLEEDAGKLVHPKGSKYSIVDLNRAGTPLLEIVSEPDITSPAMAKDYMKELHLILRNLRISDADMEKGQMRCDANISVQLKGERRKGKVASSPIVEIKNLNSFRFVEKALAHEEKKLQEEFEKWPEKKTKLTHGFDSNRGTTYPMREKEEAKDYRYFPEPDVPPFDLTRFPIEKWKKELPKLPSHHRARLSELGLTKEEANIIAKDDTIKDVIENVAEKNKAIIGKLLINNVEARKLSIEALNQIADTIRDGSPSNWVRDMIRRSVKSGKLPLEIVKETKGLAPSSEEISEKTKEFTKFLISENPDVVQKHKAGKAGALEFLIGQGMKMTKGTVNPKELREELVKQLEEEKR